MESARIAYDAEANALYIQFSDVEIAETLELSRSTYLDVDAHGVPVGLEILNPDPKLGADSSSLPEGAVLRDVLKRSAA